MGICLQTSDRRKPKYESESDMSNGYEMKYLTIAEFSGSSGLTTSAIKYVLSSDNLPTDVSGSFDAEDTSIFTFGFRTGTYTLSLDLSGTESVAYMLTGTRFEDYNDTHITFDSSNNFRMENILLPNDIDSVYFHVAKGMSLQNIRIDSLVETVEVDVSYSIINRTTNNEIQSGTFDTSGTYLLQYPLRGDVSYNFIIELSNNSETFFVLPLLGAIFPHGLRKSLPNKIIPPLGPLKVL